MIFGQTDAANLDEADNNQIKNAKAKVFVADSVDWNSKNRNKYRNDAQKRRKERKEWTIINNIDKRNDDDGYNDEAENGKAYVNFIWTKFQVKENGLATEYRYSELFFIKALVSAFTDFANASAENINEFCNNNDIDVSRLNNAADSADKDDSAK